MTRGAATKAAAARKPAAKKAAAAPAKRTPPAKTAPAKRPARKIGPVERQVRADIRALKTEHPMAAGLSEMSYNLARTLDQGAGLAIAAVNRELRANLEELAKLKVSGDDDLDQELSTPT